jgi:hypothetical protein
MTLLAAGSTLVMTSVRASAVLFDAAVQGAAVRNAEADITAQLLAFGCNGSGITMPAIGPRITLQVTSASSGAQRTVLVHAQWQGSTLAGASPRLSRISSAVVCE